VNYWPSKYLNSNEVSRLYVRIIWTQYSKVTDAQQLQFPSARQQTLYMSYAAK